MLIAAGILSVVALTVLTAWFVLQEFAYVSASRGRLQARARDGDRAAARAVALTDRLSFVLSGAQLGITVTALLVGYVSEPLLGEGLARALGFTGLAYAARLTISLIVTLVFSTIVQMVLGELAPKNWAIAEPDRLARALARSTTAYLWVAGPLIRVFDGLSNAVLRAVGIEPVEELPQGATSEEFERIVAGSREGGLLDRRLSDLLQHTLRFDDRRVEEVMTPRVDVRTVEAAEPASAVIARFDSGRSRFPVVGETIDDIVGVVGIAEVLEVPATQRDAVTARRIASPAITIPGVLPLPAALEMLRSEQRQLAVVLDEYGGFAGVVTFEDVAEQVTGPIFDEKDRSEPQPERCDGGWLVPGRTRVDELSDSTGVALPETGDASTVGGVVLQRLGSTARRGDRVELPGREASGSERVDVRVCLEVREVRRNVPTAVLMHVTPFESGEAAP